MADELVAIVMAAGQGTRMKSGLPKVLHPLCGRPMVAHVVQACLDTGAQQVMVVTGHGREQVEATLSARFDERVCSVVQREQRGTGDAVRVGLQGIEGEPGRVMILSGDTPLVTADLLGALVETASKNAGPLTLLTSKVEEPAGYGRIIRDDSDQIVAIREHRDCSPEEQKIREINPAFYVAEVGFLRKALARLTTDNSQGEFYLTDLVELASVDKGTAGLEWDFDDTRGINDRAQLAECESILRQRIALSLAREGVTVRDPSSTYVDADVEVGADAILEANVHLRGSTRVGTGARIDVGCVLENVVVAENVVLKPYSVATDSKIGPESQVGPFAHLRPATELGEQTKIGNFVETKKIHMGKGSKASHLSYLGDGQIGAQVNIGAGTIFCNYDGYNKHRTVLGDNVFIGSDSQLVAPVTVQAGAIIGAGTTVTRDVPADALTTSRAPQKNKEGYAARLRQRLQSLKKSRSQETPPKSG